MDNQDLTQLNAVAQAIYDKKGLNILALDVHNISTMTDYYLIAEGTVDRHVKALCQEIQSALKAQGESPIHVEGEKDAEWIVMDYGNFIIHLFIPELRQRYSIEELWQKGKIVDLNIEVEKGAATRKL